MKKIITLSTLVFASVILAGCTLFDTPEKTVEVVNLNTGSVEDARTQCLNLPNHQWNDASQECEKPTDKALCLQ